MFAATAFCLLTVAVVVLTAVRRIPAGQVYTLRRGRRGNLHLLYPGTHWVMPWRDHVTHHISLAGHTLQLAPGETNNVPNLRGQVYWQVLNPADADTVIDDVEAVIRERAMASLGAASQTSAAPNATAVKLALNASLRPRGILVTRVDLDPTG